MKITRYFQSCILIENEEDRILIDPSGQESSTDFGKVNAVLYTHNHSDHFDARLAAKLQSSGAQIFANKSTAEQIDGPNNIVENGQQFSVGKTGLQAIELPHCLMWDGSNGPQNTGYLIDGIIFHPGDGKELENLNVSNLFLPIAGPDISLKDSFSFAKQLGAANVIPIHYDYIGTKPEVFENANKNAGFKVTILGIGESTQL